MTRKLIAQYDNIYGDYISKKYTVKEIANKYKCSERSIHLIIKKYKAPTPSVLSTKLTKKQQKDLDILESQGAIITPKKSETFNLGADEFLKKYE